jgi:tetratricopeptide (TPR) repeat protein
VHAAGDNAAIASYLAGIGRNKSASELTSYEAMLQFWQSEAQLTSQTMMDAIRALEHVVAREPDYGQTWSMLAAQYADNCGLEIVDLPTPLEKAAAYAREGVDLDPANRRVRLALGYVRFMQNRVWEARCEAEAAYNLCPNSLMALDGIGWSMAVSGEWEKGLDWLKKAIKLNPYYRPRTRHALCFNRFRLGNYKKPYQETLRFRMPGFYWDPLLKAAACGHLGRIEEGRDCVRALLALKPDFRQRGRTLIGRYVKFEDIADRILIGLDKLGMYIES